MTNGDSLSLHRHARLYAGHPRLLFRFLKQAKTWMDGTSPAMTKGFMSGHDELKRTAFSPVMPGHDEWRLTVPPPSCPALCRASTSSLPIFETGKDVDGRNKSGHDEGLYARP